MLDAYEQAVIRHIERDYPGAVFMRYRFNGWAGTHLEFAGHPTLVAVDVLPGPENRTKARYLRRFGGGA